MARAVAIPEPNLPWVDHQEDRSFRWIMIVTLLLFLGAGVILNTIKLPEVVQKNLVDVSPRLAKLILEKQKIKPPPPKKEKPKEVKKKEPEKKKEKPKEKPKEKKKEPEKKKEVKKPDAREVAKNSGLIALSDELEDLRDSFALDDVAKLPQQTTGKQEVKVATASDLLTSSAQRTSGGIKTDTLNRTIKTNELTQRQTTRVESKIEADSKKLAKASTSKSQQGTTAKRSADEIERVFQKNKGGIFNIYNRALRKNPSLAGQVVVELRIAPGGQVIAVKILSSELGDEALERKLMLKIKKFKFSNSSVAEITITYPIDFLPS
jgi:TonB family protein